MRKRMMSLAAGVFALVGVAGSAHAQSMTPLDDYLGLVPGDLTKSFTVLDLGAGTSLLDLNLLNLGGGIPNLGLVTSSSLLGQIPTFGLVSNEAFGGFVPTLHLEAPIAEFITPNMSYVDYGKIINVGSTLLLE